MEKSGFSSILNKKDMDQNILNQIKTSLEDRKAELEKELSTLRESNGEVRYDDIGDEEDANAQEVTQYSDRLSIVTELEKHLQDVNKSLSMIEEGTYGICKYCKKEINPQRLLARPASSSCVECKATLQGER